MRHTDGVKRKKYTAENEPKTSEHLSLIEDLTIQLLFSGTRAESRMLENLLCGEEKYLTGKFPPALCRSIR